MNYIFISLAVLAFILVIMFLRSISYPAQIKKAQLLLDEGEYSRANIIIDRLLDKRNDYVPAIYLRSQIHIRQGQYLLAIAELNRILAIPNFNKFLNELDIHVQLADLYNKTHLVQKEIEEYKIILTFNPDDLNANYRIGHALYNKKDYKKAKEHLTKAVLMDPNLTDCYLPLGISSYNISDYEKAEEFLLKVLKLPGDPMDAEFYLGMIYKMKKDYDNAVSMLENSRKNKKYTVRSLSAMGEIYFEREQYDDAIMLLEQGLSSLPERTEESLAYRYLLAECYEQENRIKEAVHHWEKIAAENTNFRGTKIKLDAYREILHNSNLMMLFTSSIEELQPIIVEMISSLNYNIISKEKITPNEYQYKAYNIKRINDPPILIYFNRTTREITEGQIIEFFKRITEEKSKNGIYIATSRYSIRAKSNAQSKMIDLYDSEFVNRIIEKIQSRKRK